MESRKANRTKRVPKALCSVMQMDFFQTKAPRLHLAGKESQGNLLGTLCSIAILLIMALYASLKFDHLVNRENPDIA